MKHRVCSIVLCGLAAVLALFCAPSASASVGTACWPLRGPATELVGYGEDYVAADGRKLRHSGIDLDATAGDDVIACVAARVAFAGRVPSTSGSRLAVTLELPDSSRLTVSPLESTYVSTGDVVEAGQVLGRLAQAGDPSCSTSHLHVSLREAGEYVDPATLLVQPQATEAPAVSASPSEPAGDGPVPEPDAPAGNAPAVSMPVVHVVEEPGAASVEPQPLIETDSFSGVQEDRIEQPQARVQHEAGSLRQTSMNVLSVERLHRGSLYPVRDGGVWLVRDRHLARRTTSFSADPEVPILESSAAVSVVLFIIVIVGVRKRLTEVVNRRE